MKPHRFFIYFIIVVFAGFFPVVPAVAQKDSLRTVRVSIHDLWPTNFYDEQGIPQGLIVDLLNEVARKENWKLIYVMDEWQVGLERLKKGDVDIKMGIAYSEKRDRIYDFSKEAVYIDWGDVYVRDPGIQTILDLKDRKVAVNRKGFYLA